jgi:SNF2 family DNA or RNA helicase
MFRHYQHQLESIQIARGTPRIFDSSDPGTGKTRVAIDVFAERRARGGKCALILCPKSLIRAAWFNDFRSFAPYLSVSCAYARNRKEAFWEDHDVYVTNHDATKWLAKQPDQFFERFDTLIVDEIGAFKHSTSQRSKALNKIKQHFEYRWGMNGTPASNTVLELWNQMFVIDDGERLGPSFYKFRQTACVPKQVGPSAQMVKWEDRPGVNEAVSKLLEDVMIRHKFEDCIDIPQNHAYSVSYQLSPKQYRAYAQMEATQLAMLEGKQRIQAVNAAVVASKLLQISSGAVYDEEGNYHVVDTERYDMILDLVEQRPHTVVFFLWKHQKDLLIEAARKRELTFCLIDGSVTDTDRGKAVEYFQRGMYRICFAHPQSAAHGLTLTKGTATIWASPTYNLEHYQQGLRRIYRAGQKKKTETITVVAEDTIEERVYQALSDKQIRLDDLLQQLVTEKTK